MPYIVTTKGMRRTADYPVAFVSRRAVGEKWLSKPVQAPLKQLGRLG